MKNENDYLLILDDHAIGLKVEHGMIVIADPMCNHVRVGTNVSVQRAAHGATRVLLLPVSIDTAVSSASVDAEDATTMAGADSLPWGIHRGMLSEKDFTTSESVVSSVIMRAPDDLPPKRKHLSRTVDIFKHYGVLLPTALCPQCGMGYLVLRFGSTKKPVVWGCPMSKSNKHLALPLTLSGSLGKVRPSTWAAFLHFMICMRTNMRWGRVAEVMRIMYGIISSSTL